jgi:hypothetical protein
MSKRSSQAKTRVIVAISILVVLIVCAVGYIVWRVASATDQQTDSANKSTSTEPIPEKTIKLPNGTTATYPDIKTYRDIVFAVHDGDEHSEYVVISHKAYQDYLTYVGANADDVCGTDDAPKAIKQDIIIYGILNTSTKAITYPQNSNCIDLMAADDTPLPQFKQGAKDVLARVKGDIQSFLQVVTIK